MTCPQCNHPMEMSRYYPGETKTFTCNACWPRLNRRPTNGYSGRITLSAKVPLVHQERIRL